MRFLYTRLIFYLFIFIIPSLKIFNSKNAQSNYDCAFEAYRIRIVIKDGHANLAITES